MVAYGMDYLPPLWSVLASEGRSTFLQQESICTQLQKKLSSDLSRQNHDEMKSN
jgi:hypothetical protein